MSRRGKLILCVSFRLPRGFQVLCSKRRTATTYAREAQHAGSEGSTRTSSTRFAEFAREDRLAITAIRGKASWLAPTSSFSGGSEAARRLLGEASAARRPYLEAQNRSPAGASRGWPRR